MSETIIEPRPKARRFDIPVKMGILIGVLGAVLTTVSFMFILPASYIGFFAVYVLSFIITVVLYGVTGSQQRKANGGYITLEDAFGAIFVAILISVIISSVWGVLYAKVVDPEVGERTKAATLTFMEGMNAPEEKLEQTAKDLDQQLADSLKFGNLLYAFAKSLIIHSIFGFICAAIVRRNPPAEMR